jgi:hypothetical protein
MPPAIRLILSSTVFVAILNTRLMPLIPTLSHTSDFIVSLIAPQQA